MVLPTFLILGAARCATTSLHYYLDQHPGITMSRTKEPNFFAFDHTTSTPTPLIDPSSAIVTKSTVSRREYEALFGQAGPGDAVGEASPLYLYTRESPEQIRRLIEQPALIAVVRNPIDRAYSHWLHIKRGHPDASVEGFRQACEIEMATGGEYEPYASGTHVLRMGRYDEQLDRYARTFGADRLLVLAYEPLVADPTDALARICTHLGVAPFEFETDVQYNPSGVTSGTAGALVRRAVNAVQPTAKKVLPSQVVRRLGKLRAARDRPDAAPPVPDDLRRTLAEWFEPSVRRLQEEGWVDTTGWADFPAT